jgi:hypothetical protein
VETNGFQAVWNDKGVKKRDSCILKNSKIIEDAADRGFEVKKTV